MKYFFILATITVLLLASCGGSSNNELSVTKDTRLVSFINAMISNSPGWDNNDITKEEMQKKLCKSFAKNMQDSNLLEGYVFQLHNVENSFGRVYRLTFIPLQLKEAALLRDLPIQFEIEAIVSDTLAKSLKEAKIYRFAKYSKRKSDTTYDNSILPIDIAMENNLSHNLIKCDLGTHSVTIDKIEAYNP